MNTSTANSLTMRIVVGILVLGGALLCNVSALSQKFNHGTMNKTTSNTRRSFLGSNALFIPSTLAGCAALLTSQPKLAFADLNSAAASGVPLLGRFEQLKGAKSFIGNWKYEATKGVPKGELVFLKNGEVELRSISSDINDPASIILGYSAVPWKYVSPKGADTMVTVSFTLDQDGQDDVLIFQGSFDSAGGPDRIMEGSIATGRAEIGARGSGPMKQIGSFTAAFSR